MNKYLTIGALITAAVCLFGVWQGIGAIKDSAWQDGYKTALNAQLNTDNQHYVQSLERFNHNYAATLKMVETVSGFQDDSTVIAADALA